MALTDQVIMPGSDYQAICDATRNLTGKTETLKSGEISTELNSVTPLYEMWVLSKEGVADGNMNIAAHFYTRTLDEEFTGIIFSVEDGSLRYIRPDGSNLLVAEATSQIGGNKHQYSWVANPEYRAIVCKTPPTGALLTWLQANGVKQASYTAVETNHTCSGTVFDLQNSTITSEAPYDAMQKVTLDITIPEQEKTVSPTETSQTVTPDTHKVLSKVTVNPISPTYVGSDIPRQPAKTITPSSTSQMAIRGGSYATGTIYVDPVPTEMKVADLSMASGNQVISNTSGKYMTSVTVKKPNTLIEKNVRFDREIGGVVGTYSPHVCVFPELISVNALLENAATTTYDVEFWYGDSEYCTAIRATPQNVLSYYHESVGEWHEVYKNNQWLAEPYRKIVLTEYKSNVETALRKVGYIQENQAVDPNAIQKTYTSNGSYSIIPSAPYNGISEVQIQVDVSSGVDLPFTKLATVSTDNGILSFSFTGYYDTIIAKRSGTNDVLTAVFGNNLKASFSIGSSGGDLSTSGGFSYNQVGNKFNVTWNICESSGSVWYEGSYDIYGCLNG